MSINHMDNKIYISLSFDDGRDDTYYNAFRVMKKYGLVGTVHITTGYIDKTWEPKEGWLTADEPMTIPNLYDLMKNGIEISAHGDKHKTEKSDFNICVSKLKKWGLVDGSKVGFSVPNSELSKKELPEFAEENGLSYIRCGRNEKSYSVLCKISYILYNYFRIRRGYFYFNRFNKMNIHAYFDAIPLLYSVVVKNTDDPKMLLDYIKSSNSGDWIIFMFHSILRKDDKKYGRDSWFWDCEKFEYLCENLKKMQDSNNVKIETIMNVIKKKEYL